MATRKKVTAVVTPAPIGSAVGRVEKDLIGLHDPKDPLPSSATITTLVDPVVLGTDITKHLSQGQDTNLSLTNSDTPENWFAQQKSFVEASSVYEVVHAFATHFGIKNIPVRSELSILDAQLRPEEIARKMYLTKEN